MIEKLHMERYVEDFIRAAGKNTLQLQKPTGRERIRIAQRQTGETFRKVFPYVLAEALLAKGALLGSGLSFMMAVTTLSLPSPML